MHVRRISSLIHLAVLSFALLVSGATGTRSAELIMFEQPYCEWCEAWEEEVGIIYSKTSEGKRVPIRRIDIHGARPADLNKIKPVIFTPTFVLVQNGAEVGRILGYPGEDHFWGLLNHMLEQLPMDQDGTL
jgi:hypothetical protein